MPYFKWVGVDVVGVAKRGKQAAYSAQDLSEQLLRRGIALLKCKSMYAPSFVWPITAQIKAHVFQQQVKLLRAGILLPNVLEISAQQACNPIMCDALFSIARDVRHGVSLSKSFEKHIFLCDPIVAVMLKAGHESGNITTALEHVALYFHKQYTFNKSIRAALAMPFLTLLFFIGISAFIFIFIIPRFADMFSSLQQELPPLTQIMIRMSEFICSVAMLYVLLVCGITAILVYRYFSTSGKKVWNNIVSRIPFVGMAVWQHHMCQALQALALLVSSGVSLVEGIKIVSDSVDHDVVKSQFVELHDKVASGQLLSNAMNGMSIFMPELIALIHVGEESGTLGHSLESAALVYNNKLEESLRRFIFFLQPTVIIILGLMVTILIFAVYLPIMQLSHVL